MIEYRLDSREKRLVESGNSNREKMGANSAGIGETFNINKT